MHGSVELIMGPMFAGKTTELLRRYRRFKIANKSCILIKFSGDNRYSEDAISTHDKYMVFDSVIKSDDLNDVKELVKGIDVVFIDEAQFFKNIEMVEDFANSGQIVILSALTGTFLKTPFENISKLIPMCDNITKLTAICHKCGDEASFTMKKCASTQVIEVGGNELYVPTCRKCFEIVKS